MNIKYSTKTDRKDNQAGYSEAMGLGVARGGIVKVSKDTVLNIVGSSLGETPAKTTTGTWAGAGNYYGAGVSYGIKLEGGQIEALGTTNVELESQGAHTTGLLIGNFFKTSTSGSVWGKSAAVFNNVNVTATSTTGDVLGVETSFTPDESQKYDVILETLGTTTLNVSSESGKAIGVYLDAETTIQFDGDLHATASSTTGESYSMYNKNGILNVQGTNNTLNGDVAVVEGGVIKFASEKAVETSTLINGNVTSDSSSKIVLNKASLELAKGNTVAMEGKLESTDGRLVLNEAKQGVVKVDTLTEGSSLQAVASSSLNDELGGDLDTFSKTLAISQGAQGASLFMTEGLVAGEKTAQLKADGSVDQATVTSKTNSIMQSSLEMASALPLAMNRILTNDVRKRMGDLRASEGKSGAWARYDGGKLSGEHGLDSDFHTIQVGVDTVPTPDSARFGVAFSYTDGDMDYVRNSSDMKAYSLAGYATWMGDNGMYVDTVVRMAKFDNDLTVDKALKGSMDSLAMSVSGEAGWRFDLNKLFYVEPQAEVMYTYIDGDNFELGNAQYTVDSMN
ncbi:MAG: autotransporter outer membrane beta-barrel domain-containing protein, partial [Sutterella wadsworthensis]|nr:autotransporter outer membrane beta-barrel domain-containing protein [Sutterella wadsworthensis]